MFGDNTDIIFTSITINNTNIQEY